DPHLLERRPAIGKAAAEQVAGRVAGHEATVHLQSAPVRIARVPPGAFVAVDTKPRALVRRMNRLDVGAFGCTDPEVQDRPRTRPDRALRAHTPCQDLPAPRLGAVAPDRAGVNVSLPLREPWMPSGLRENLLRRERFGGTCRSGGQDERA